mmetsp:Transcript_25211/g.79497  ORF Transcript_25211/g.79497 Transcript_25211/m.79497 type:complete len:231 (+) Transcript_25211:1986-2678(+)
MSSASLLLPRYPRRRRRWRRRRWRSLPSELCTAVSLPLPRLQRQMLHGAPALRRSGGAKRVWRLPSSRLSGSRRSLQGAGRMPLLWGKRDPASTGLTWRPRPETGRTQSTEPRRRGGRGCLPVRHRRQTRAESSAQAPAPRPHSLLRETARRRRRRIAPSSCGGGSKTGSSAGGTGGRPAAVASRCNASGRRARGPSRSRGPKLRGHRGCTIRRRLQAPRGACHGMPSRR